MPTFGAELVELDPVRIVTPILLGDVVAFFALGAREGDLWPNVSRLTHDMNLSLYSDLLLRSCWWCLVVPVVQLDQ